jgi:hypothetical protein
VIGYDLAAALPELQAQAESLMRDLCEVREPDTQGPYDPDTNTHTPVPGALVYSGKCRVRHLSRAEEVATLAEQQVTLVDYRITVPASASGIRVGLFLKVTATADPDLLNKRLSVVGVAKGSIRIQRAIFGTLNEG